MTSRTAGRARGRMRLAVLALLVLLVAGCDGDVTTRFEVADDGAVGPAAVTLEFRGDAAAAFEPGSAAESQLQQLVTQLGGSDLQRADGEDLVAYRLTVPSDDLTRQTGLTGVADIGVSAEGELVRATVSLARPAALVDAAVEAGRAELGDAGAEAVAALLGVRVVVQMPGPVTDQQLTAMPADSVSAAGREAVLALPAAQLQSGTWTVTSTAARPPRWPAAAALILVVALAAVAARAVSRRQGAADK